MSQAQHAADLLQAARAESLEFECTRCAWTGVPSISECKTLDEDLQVCRSLITLCGECLAAARPRAISYDQVRHAEHCGIRESAAGGCFNPHRFESQQLQSSYARGFNLSRPVRS